MEEGRRIIREGKRNRERKNVKVKGKERRKEPNETREVREKE